MTTQQKISLAKISSFEGQTMRFQWLLLLFPSLSSLFLLTLPADAAKLLMWRFDANRNQLEFSTDSSVQPKAQLYTNPTRLIIDLPGISFDRPTINRSVSEEVVEVRVGQYNPNITRIVVELAPGYTLDPKQVEFQRTDSSRWSVQIPQPERIARSSPTKTEIIPLTVSTPAAPTRDAREPSDSDQQLATIEAVELANNDTQLLIRANRSIKAKTQWNAQDRTFLITIPNAQLTNRIQGPKLGGGSPLSQILVREKDSRTVTILVRPNANTQLGELNQLTDQLLALQLRPAKPTPRPIQSIPVPPPERRTATSPLPRVSNRRIVVMIDPGHGGKDPGAVGLGGLQEKDVILPISLQVAALLEQQGVQAVLTRSDDRFISLPGRVQMARRSQANLFVSIHANAVGGRRSHVSGFEVYHYSRGLRLAQTIHNSVMQSISMRDRGVRRARFYVLRNNSIPAALVEVGFVTGTEDAPRLASPAFQRQMAEAIARGILQYIQQGY
jgi:N-acetylmuramoyl-L-alanine amidase